MKGGTLSSTAVLYLMRDKGDHELKSGEQEYKLMRIKVTLKLYENSDVMMKTVRILEERTYEKSSSSVLKDAHKTNSRTSVWLTPRSTEKNQRT